MTSEERDTEAIRAVVEDGGDVSEAVRGILSHNALKSPWLRVAIGVLGLGIGVWVLLATLILSGRIPDTTPPYVYSDEHYTAIDSSLCAGDPLQFVITSTVTRAPARVSFYYTIYSLDTKRTLLNSPGSTNEVIYLPQDLDQTLTEIIVFTNTTQLAPGDYEYRRLAQEQTSQPQTYSVPFEVSQCR